MPVKKAKAQNLINQALGVAISFVAGVRLIRATCGVVRSLLCISQAFEVSELAQCNMLKAWKRRLENRRKTLHCAKSGSLLAAHFSRLRMHFFDQNGHVFGGGVLADAMAEIEDMRRRKLGMISLRAA